MYKGYCITEDTINDLALFFFYADKDRERSYEDALLELESRSKDVTDNIFNIIKGDDRGIIDGEALQQVCMPTDTDKYDVFISHSHKNKDCAIDLAIYLKMRYGVKCFVDGFVWGSCDKDILRPIDDIWSTHDTKEGSYSYDKRNYSTSHVHAMISMALLEMIDQCECCIFIKPEEDYSITGINDMTLSPWIYEEITMFNKVGKQKPLRVRRIIESFDTDFELRIRYKMDLSNMPELKKSHLQVNLGDKVMVRSSTLAYRWLDYVYDNVK